MEPGGRVEELLLRQRSTGRLIATLLTHRRNVTAIWSNAHWLGAMLAPWANRIANATYVFDGVRYELPRNEWPVRNTSLHGLLWDRALEVVEQRDGPTEATLTLAYGFGADAGYPFAVRVFITYRLSVDDGFSVHTLARNDARDGTEAPFYHVRDAVAARLCWRLSAPARRAGLASLLCRHRCGRRPGCARSHVHRLSARAHVDGGATPR